MSSWDHKVAGELRERGLSQEDIGAVIGIIAEHRQMAYLEGLKRGYNNDFLHGTEHADGETKNEGDLSQEEWGALKRDLYQVDYESYERLIHLAKENPPPPEWFEGEEEKPF